MTISIVNGLPDIVSVQKKVYPLIFTAIVSEQPTTQPVATAYGLVNKGENVDGSGWKNLEFSLDRWYAQVESHLVKTEISVEAIQDIKSIGLSEDIIVDNMVDETADDINKSLIEKLNAISSTGGAYTVPAGNDYDQARIIYANAHAELAKLERTTGIRGTYIVAGGKVFEALLGSSMVSEIPDTNVYKCNSGAILVHDKYATSDYFTVGVKKQVGEYELSSLVWSPYDYDKSGGFMYQLKATDAKSLQPVYGIIARQAITTAPHKDGAPHDGAVEIDWDNLGTLANSSELSSTHAVTFS